MSSQRLSTRYLLPGALLFLGLHAVSIVLTRPNSMAGSYPFMTLAPWLAVAASCLQAKRSPPGPRIPWIMLSIALFLWAAGMSLSAWENLSGQVSYTVAHAPDFLYFLYGVPILLVLASPSEQERIPAFMWLDGTQTVITACMVYLTLFSALPFGHPSAEPISVSLLTLTYSIENLVLACGATLRLIAHPEEGEQSRFFEILCIFLWTYLLCAFLFNHMVVQLEDQTGLYDLLAVIPFLLLAVAALSSIPHGWSRRISSGNKQIASFIENASPMFYTCALVTLGVINIRKQFSLGIAAIVIALAIYAIRNTILQIHLMQSQHSLREARDRLEQMSLHDSLTGIANRRCFDETLNLEWNRTFRMEQALSLLLIDLDYFKILNDRNGHQSGDQCLVRVAAALQTALPRSGDLLARYGGEEFAALLPSTSRAGAETVAANMHASVLALGIENESETGGYVTISIGIATQEFALYDVPSDLVEAADRALYRAKRSGRNRTE